MRASASVPPPGDVGTSNRIGRVGYSDSAAYPPMANSAHASTITHRLNGDAVGAMLAVGRRTWLRRRNRTCSCLSLVLGEFSSMPLREIGMTGRNRKRLVSVLLMLCSAALGQLPAAGYAQAYPNKAIRVIVPFAAGSGTDILARILTEDLRGGLGWSFVVDTRAGGSAQIAAELAAKAAPDGYTVLLSTNTPHS